MGTTTRTGTRSDRANLMAMRQAMLRSPGSAKLERLREIAEEAEQDGMKVLVFSYFLGVLDVVGTALGDAVVGRIDGSVPPQLRQQIVEEFTARPGHGVLLSQIEAGGVGINMQAAYVVVWVEVDPRPSKDAPDPQPFGVVTAYCKIPARAAAEDRCPAWVNETL